MADIRPSTEIELELHDYIGSAYSPTVEVTETEDGHTVSITSRKASGIVTDEFDVKDGFDPVATVARGDHKAVLTVTDKFGTTTADIPDGVSPRVEITEDEDGHTVSITDAYGTHSYEVPDWSGDEQERVEAEERRVAAETARSTAESQRVAAETQRASAETARKSAENARSAAEGTRVQSESQRAANEAQRAAGEVQRGLNEQARVASETARETAWETMSAAVLSATDDANEAAATAMGVSVSMLGNTAHTTITGTSVHASDAISFPPVGLSVHGASVQSGTPSTASPKPISHVTSATVRVTDGWSVPVDLDGNVLRSAGGAVDDIVELSYAGVGATEGTAVYDVTLHANVGTVTLNGTEEWSLSSLGLLRTTAISDLVRLPKSTTELIPLTCTQTVATSYADLRGTTGSIAIAESGNVFVNLPSITTVGAIRSWLASHPMTVVYPLATPSETSLGRVTLQSLPAPEFAMAVDGGAVQAPFDLSYVYDVSINEQERAEEWLSLKSDAVQATSDAGSAATSATTAAASASAAATNANATASSISAAAARGDYDGYSPTVAISDTTDGHTVTITDRQGPHAYTVPTYADEEQARQDAWDQLSQDAQEAIDAATEAAESVSDDVDALYNGIDMLRSDIRTAEVEGGVAQVENAAKAVPVDLAVYGSSTQDGTPTPDAPVPILSVDAPVLTMVGGKNLLDPTLMLDQVGWHISPIYAPEGTVLTMSTNYPQTGEMPCYFRQPSSSQSTSNYVYLGHPITQTVGERGFVEVVQRRASGEDSFANYQWQIELGSTATAYEPYSGVTAPIDLQGHELRSLPDGTKDRLDLIYDRPSSRKGWAWYKASIDAVSGAVTYQDGGFGKVTASGAEKGFARTKPTDVAYSGSLSSPYQSNMFARGVEARPNNTIYNYHGNLVCLTEDTSVVPSRLTTEGLAEFNEWNLTHPIQVVYKRQTPVTIQLEDIELPVIPTDHATVYVTGGSAQPTWHMDYQIDADAELVEVQERVDVLEYKTDHMWGNRLTGELSGEVLTASDAYTAPPLAVGVDGKSEQDTTTGKNLFDKDGDNLGYYDSNGEFVSSTSIRWWSVPVTEGDTVRYANSTNCIMTYWNGGELVGHATQTSSASHIAEAGIDEIRGYCTSGGFDTCIVTKNNSDLTYEPYTGGKPAPSPDYAQEIASVVNPALTVTGKNILDPSFLTRCGWTESNGEYTGTPRQLYQGLANHIVPVPCAPNTRYVFAWYQISSTESTNGNAAEIRFVYSDGTQSAARYTDLNHTFVATSDDGKTVTGLRFSYVRNPTLVVQCIQLVPLSLWDGEIVESYTPYIAPTTVTLPVTIRSLPDGTKDSATYTYLRPSTREGWAWYSGELVQAVGETLISALTNWNTYTISGHQVFRSNRASGHTNTSGTALCDALAVVTTGPGSMPDNSININAGYWTAGHHLVIRCDSCATVSAMLELLGNAELIYKLATPVTTTLDPIELPSVIGPSCTIWATADATPELQVTYERDVTIAYDALLAAIADLATS